jgi:hypothetical protein
MFRSCAKCQCDFNHQAADSVFQSRQGWNTLFALLWFRVNGHPRQSGQNTKSFARLADPVSSFGAFCQKNTKKSLNAMKFHPEPPRSADIINEQLSDRPEIIASPPFEEPI